MLWIKQNKVNQLSKWHKWFAWFPVRVGQTPDGDYIKIWWDYVLRCGEYHYDYKGNWWSWKYKK